MKYKFFLAIFFILLFSSVILAEQNGTLDLGNINRTITTGLYAYTAPLWCINDIDCYTYKCYNDYDGVSSSGYSGWCYPYDIGKCLDDGNWRASGYKLCYTANKSVVCQSSGDWQETYCQYGCTDGVCNSGPSNTTGPDIFIPGPSSNTNTSISITIPPEDLEIVQGESALDFVTIKNTGTTNLGNLRISLSEIPADYYTINPSSYSDIQSTKTKTFTINFSIPEDAPIGEYNSTVTATTNMSSATASANFILVVAPNSETAERDIIPKYNVYLSELDELQKNITELKNKGYNVSELMDLYNSLKNKLQEVNTSISNEDYYEAYQLINNVKTMIDDIKSKMQTAEKSPPPAKSDLTIILAAIIIIVAAAVILLYLFWPTEEMGFHHERGWIHASASPLKKIFQKLARKKNPVDKLVKKLKTKKEEKFKYDYKE